MIFRAQVDQMFLTVHAAERSVSRLHARFAGRMEKPLEQVELATIRDAVDTLNSAAGALVRILAVVDVCPRCGSDGLRGLKGTPLRTCTHCGADCI